MIELEIEVYAGDTLRVPIIGLGSLVDAEKIYFSAKRRKTDADADSIVHIEYGVGLIYLNGEETEAPENGDFVVLDDQNGDGTIYLHASESVKIAEGTYYCDIKVIESNGDVTTKGVGEIYFKHTITKAVS